MSKVKFTIEGEEIITVVNETEMTDNFVNRLIRTFIDLGWIITEVKTVGFFEIGLENTVHIEFELTENDGNVEPYSLDEDSFNHILSDDERFEPTKKIGYVGMSNVSKA